MKSRLFGILILGVLIISVATKCALRSSTGVQRKSTDHQIFVMPRAKPLPTPKRLEFVGFSATPPIGEGWHGLSSQYARSAFGFDTLYFKALGPQRSIHAYLVSRRSRSQAKDPLQILNDEVERAIRPRGSLLRTTTESLSGAACLRWEVIRQGQEPFHEIGAEAENGWVSHSYGYLCSHPEAVAYLVEFGYFVTRPEGDLEPANDGEGERFLQGVSFTSLGAHVEQSKAGTKPRGLALSYDSLWISDEDNGTVTRLDPLNMATLSTINVGAKPQGIGAGFGSIWVPNWQSGTVSRLDPEQNRVAHVISVGAGPTQAAVGFGAVWVTCEKSSSVVRIDPTTNDLVATIFTNGKPVAVATGEGGVWVENYKTREIWRINPENNQIAELIKVGRGRHFIAVGASAVWATNSADDTVSKIDPRTHRVIATISVGRVPAGLALLGKELWVANFGDGTVVPIDTRTNLVQGTPIPVGVNPFLVAGSASRIWVLNVWGWRDGSVSEIGF